MSYLGKQGKKVYKSTAVQFYKCLFSLLLLLARVKWLESKNKKKLQCSLANCKNKRIVSKNPSNMSLSRHKEKPPLNQEGLRVPSSRQPAKDKMYACMELPPKILSLIAFCLCGFLGYVRHFLVLQATPIQLLCKVRYNLTFIY